MRRRHAIFLLFLMGLTVGLRAQTYALHIDTAAACPGDTVSFGVWMENFSNIGAITLFIRYDSARLAYLGHSDVHPSFPGLISNGMTYPAVQVGVSWSASMSGASPGSSRLMNLDFVHKRDDDSLWFAPNCEVADFTATVLSVNFNGGLCQHLQPAISIQPSADTVLVSQQNHVISCEAMGASGYRWHAIDTNDVLYVLDDSLPYFSGTGTKDLTLHFTYTNFPQFPSQYRYTCRIEGCGEQWTDTVSPVFIWDAGLGSPSLENRMLCWPVPASDILNVRLGQSYAGMPGRIVLYSIDGRVMASMRHDGSTTTIHCAGLPAGTYIIRFIPASQDAAAILRKISLKQRH